MMPKDLHELPKLRDSLSYLYVEHCRIEQEDASIALWDKQGCTPVPCAALCVLMLGPGCSITHAAVRALADNGCSLVWVGEEGVRCYAAATGETRRAYRLLKQAEKVCDPVEHREVVWRMYEKRFGYRLDRSLSLNQIRGMEGARVRDTYAEAAQTYGVEWKGRSYDRRNWNASDPVNRALSAANACLNGLCHAAVVSGGYSPALGFIHTGKQLSFVYDIADLYKSELTIPLAFRVASESTANLGTRVRHAMRDAFREQRVLQRILPDIDEVLGLAGRTPDDDPLDDDSAMPTPLWEELWGPGAAVAGEDG